MGRKRMGAITGDGTQGDWSLVTWFIYAIILHARLIAGMEREKGCHYYP